MTQSTNNPNFADSILNSISADNTHLSNIRRQLLQATKVQMKPVLPFAEPVGTRTIVVSPEKSTGRGANKVIQPAITKEVPRYFYDDTETFGVYRKSGGSCLGVVGKDFMPMDLGLYLDTIEQSILECGNGLDISKLSYTEHKGGRKVSFDLPAIPFELKKSPMVGDVVDVKFQFKTGFDGLTKVSLGYMTKRLWCTNGAASWKNDIALSCKNTIGNQGKIMLICTEIFKCMAEVKEYAASLDNLFSREITKAEVDKFLVDLTGYDAKDLKTFTTERRNILNTIQQSIAIEMDNTGANAFSLLQGITRHTTHNLSMNDGIIDETQLMYGTPAEMNRNAHKLVFAL